MFPGTIKPILIEFGCEDCGVGGVASYGGGLGYLGADEVIELVEKGITIKRLLIA